MPARSKQREQASARAERARARDERVLERTSQAAGCWTFVFRPPGEHGPLPARVTARAHTRGAAERLARRRIERLHPSAAFKSDDLLVHAVEVDTPAAAFDAEARARIGEWLERKGGTNGPWRVLVLQLQARGGAARVADQVMIVGPAPWGGLVLCEDEARVVGLCEWLNERHALAEELEQQTATAMCLMGERDDARALLDKVLADSEESAGRARDGDGSDLAEEQEA
jgi:hypothetical protein